jgi:beta-phosphoglucomutase-like phosphatase (HAD superfamily)
VGGDQVARHKPAPDVFLRAAALLGVDPAACVVIEDSLRGIQAAHAGGMFAVALQVPGAMVHSAIPPEAADLSVTALAEFHAWWRAGVQPSGINLAPSGF